MFLYFDDFILNTYNSDDPNSYQHIPFEYVDIFYNNEELEEFFKNNFNLRGLNA